MNSYYTLLALDLVEERAREAAEWRRLSRLRSDLPPHPGIVRRGLANGLALVSRRSAAAVRRLDECIADDLTRTLAAAK